MQYRFGGPAAIPGIAGGGWTVLRSLDFTALTPTSWVPADVGTPQTVDGFVFELHSDFNSGTTDIGASGLTTTDTLSGVGWMVGQGANALDLTAEDHIGIGIGIVEPDPWVGSFIGIQVGDSAPPGFNFNPGSDWGRTGDPLVQLARRDGTISAKSYAFPPNGALTFYFFTIVRGSCFLYGQTGVTEMPDPPTRTDLKGWTRIGVAGNSNADEMNLSSNATNHILFRFNGAATTSTELRECRIWRFTESPG